MTPAALQAWRARMGWTAKRAAQELGLSQNGYAAYERGWVWEGGKYGGQAPRPIPRHVELACCELERRETDGWQTSISVRAGALEE